MSRSSLMLIFSKTGRRCCCTWTCTLTLKISYESFYFLYLLEENHCHSNPCQNNGTCNPLQRPPYYHCTCKISFYGDYCESKIKKSLKKFEEVFHINKYHVKLPCKFFFYILLYSSREFFRQYNVFKLF